DELHTCSVPILHGRSVKVFLVNSLECCRAIRSKLQRQLISQSRRKTRQEAKINVRIIGVRASVLNPTNPVVDKRVGLIGRRIEEHLRDVSSLDIKLRWTSLRCLVWDVQPVFTA
ncbi:MAG: hypothetical protein ACK55I_34215, partial [bacterium]